jgi:hypothetical protein
MTAARIALFVVVAVALAVTANLVLLGIATGPKDPVGRLTPQAGLVVLPSPVTTTAPLATTPARTSSEPPPAHHGGETADRSSQQDD